MKFDDIIHMALEACSPHQVLNTDLVFLKRFAAIVSAHAQAEEREACAKVCEETELPFDIDLWRNSTKKEMTAHTAHGLAAAIRARGNG